MNRKKRDFRRVHPILKVLFALIGIYFFEGIWVSDAPWLIKTLGIVILLVGFSPIITSALGSFIWWESIFDTVSLPYLRIKK